jgi:hypothetical protein
VPEIADGKRGVGGGAENNVGGGKLLCSNYNIFYKF